MLQNNNIDKQEKKEQKKEQKKELKFKLSQKKDDKVKIGDKELENKETTRPDNYRDEGGKAIQTVVVKGKKKKRPTPFLRGGRGQVHIKATYNNTIVSITDLNGATLVWASAGKCGFKGPRKATPYAAGMVVRTLVDKIRTLGIKELDAFVKGVGMGREAAIRAFDSQGLHVVSIKDVTPIPHGGCRPPKRRRV